MYMYMYVYMWVFLSLSLYTYIYIYIILYGEGGDPIISEPFFWAKKKTMQPRLKTQDFGAAPAQESWPWQWCGDPK